MSYWAGTDILGADLPPLVPPPAPVYGPASSPGTYYTDKTTITAVQKKLEQLGYFHGVVDGKFGPVTEAAIFNFSGQHGPPDDAVLAKLGLSKSVSFDDAEVDSMIVQAKTATTPAQVKVVAAKIEKLAENAPPAVKQEIAAAKQEAAAATTPEQAAAAGAKLANATAKLKSGMPGWQIGLIVGGIGTVLLSVMTFLIVRKPSAARSTP